MVSMESCRNKQKSLNSLSKTEKAVALKKIATPKKSVASI